MTDTYLHIVARITPAIFGVRLVLRMVKPYLTRICAYNAASYTPTKTPTTLFLTKRPRTPPPSHHRSSCPPRSRWGWKVSLFILETSKPVHASARISPSPPFPIWLLGAGFALSHVCGSSRRVCGKLLGGVIPRPRRDLRCACCLRVYHSTERVDSTARADQL